MRKKIATLLAGCLVIQSLTGFAVPAETSAKIADTTVSKVQEAKIPGSSKRTAANDTGSLEIEVHPSLNYTGTITVKAGDNTKDIKFTDDLSSGTVRFDGVKAGEQTITIEGPKFARYTQKAEIESGWLHKLLICSSKRKTKDWTSGWLQAGDANNDGTVNSEDKDIILDEIRKPSGKDGSDLNNDGKTDIADLQILVQNLDEEAQESSVEKLWNPKYVTSLSDGSNVTNAFLENGEIELTPKNKSKKISASNPAGLEFKLAEDDAAEEDIPEIGGIRILSPYETDKGEFESDITDGTVTVELSDGTTSPGISLKQAKNIKKASAKLYKASAIVPSVTTEPDGSLILDLGTQVAVKRVIITINGTRKDEKLANIAKVEFVNDMEKRIPPPQLDIPEIHGPEPGNEQLSVSWKAQNNVTGYELYVEGPVGKQHEIKNDTIKVPGNKYVISNIKSSSLINFEEYTIKVRSVNGEWKSPWSGEVKGKPEPLKKPAAPDNVKLTSGNLSLNVSWKDMSDSSAYMVYYKEYDEPDDKYQPVIAGFVPDDKTGGKGIIEATSYKITNLLEEKQYSVYVVGWNALGWGKPSLVSVGSPKSSLPPELPNYMLLNTSNGEGKVSAHIISATYGGHGGAKMVDSPLDTVAKSALGTVDNDYNSYWSKTDWDDGVAYPANDRGINITLDNDYKMNFITFAAFDEAASLETVRIDYWSSSGSSAKQAGARLLRRLDGNGNQFYIVKFDNTITANKIRLSVGRGYTRAEMKIGEIRFYNYDSLEDDIMGLYTDEMHTTLRSDVTENTINSLENRLETPDDSGEKHPLYKELKIELDTARNILHDKPSPSYEVINQITAKKDGHLGFTGLNPWQPLGKTVYAGETLIVYVGHNTKRTGDSTNLQLVMTQYHSESNSLAKSSAALKIGRNEITVPQIADKDFEHGGQLYVAYSGNSASDKYAVRVLGGSDIPVLNVYKKTGTERTKAISDYIDSLEEYVPTIQEEHEKLHKNSGNKAVNYNYDEKNCILNATDIMMDEMMYSLPAKQILAPLANKSDKVTALDTALKAMDDTMTLFYHHKGLSNTAGTQNGNNALPAQHLNIRYMRMFAGAFMYAAGTHVGIEYGSSQLSSATGIKSFGWGIAHEIGHDINQGTYAVAEVTNNYFSQLLTGTQRYSYDNVYKKVTSGTIGRSSNVFTQLALYWQLHLAFDDNKDDQHIYDSYTDQFNNIFFARVDTYSRNPAKAPQGGLAFVNTDQNLMRLSCAAANANILPFFERWGMVPDENTIAYAKKYGEPSEKALYYVNPDARNYRIDNPGEKGTIKDKDVVTASVQAESNRVKVTMDTNEDTNLILGYEIIRSMTSNGYPESKVVGFQPVNKNGATVFTDTVSTINNRVMSYTVKAVDKFLNYSAPADAGQVKIQTDGVLDKSLWTVSTNMSSSDDKEIENNDDDPDSGYNASNPANVPANKLNTIDRIIDNEVSDNNVYNGTAPKNGDAEIIIDMHSTKEATAIKYFGGTLSSVKIEVSTNASIWTNVKEVDTINGGQIIWFDSVNENERDSWIGTYDTRYIKFTTSQTGNISISEIDVCGPSGDNIEFMQTGSNQPSIGILKNAYQYGSKPEDVIPADSLIFTGVYKGNPAYNVVLLYDTEGNVIGAKDDKVNAGQVIFAEVPANGNLGETSNGTWVYYVEPGQWDSGTLQAIKGVRGELYRTDDAITLEGERITSDTLIIQIPETLPEITLTGKVPENN